jgi:hypothetical protein
LDGPNGRDNAAGRLVQQQAELSASSVVGSEQSNEDVRTGAAAPFGILRIRGFSGLFLDDSVQVDFYIGAAPQEVDGETQPFVGTYPFPIRLDSLADGGEGNLGQTVEGDSRFHDDAAYVNSSTMVARFQGVPLGLFSTRVVTHGLLVEARLEWDRQTGLWSVVDGMMTGHFPVEGVLSAIPRLGFDALQRPVCSDDPYYPALKLLTCSAPDLRTEGGTDYGPGVCNSVSFGVGFKAVPALLGPAVEIPTETFCEAETDPANDDCAE